MYYRGAAAAIVVYDITKKDSFNGAKSWVKELQRRGDPNVIIALAGNKADLESRRKVEFEEANSYAEENGIFHIETSAKNANNVKALFVVCMIIVRIQAFTLIFISYFSIFYLGNCQEVAKESASTGARGFSHCATTTRKE
mmetsp:Transcript_8548/g.18813  ORF Transcript_8548/g.18813 Transcript_8548/m.18813 type:complete len:141 (-) Transcript_8548:1845-2267(-)